MLRFFNIILISFIIVFSFNPQVFSRNLNTQNLKVQGSIFLDFKKNLIKGELLFYLKPNTNYQIYSKGFKITQIILGKKHLISPLFSKEGNILILTGNRHHVVKLKFKKQVDFWAFPVEIFLPFFPYPLSHPFSYHLKLYLPKKNSKYVLVPYESFSLKHSRYYSIYTFKSSTPTSPPPLIVGNLIKKKVKLKNLSLSFYCLKSEKQLCNFVTRNINAVSNATGVIENFPLLFHNYFILLENNFSRSISAPRFITLYSSPQPQKIFQSIAKNSLLYGVYWKDKTFGKALSFFLLSYLPSTKKKELRKNLLLEESPFARDTFFLINLLKNKKVVEKTNEFYQKFAFHSVDHKDFLKLFFENGTFPELKYFKKVSLSFQKNFLVKQDNKYLFDYTIFSSLPIPYNIKVQIITLNNTISQELSFKNNTYIEKRLLLSALPKAVVLDPDYLIYRKLSPKEPDISLDNMLKAPGVVLVRKEKLFKYKNFLSFFKLFNYSIVTISQKNYYQVSEFFHSKQNAIFLGLLPREMYFLTPPKEGLYFFVMPSPSAPFKFKAFLKISDFEDNSLIKIFRNNLNATELWVKPNKILKKRLIKGRNGLYFSLNNFSSIIQTSKLLGPEDVALKLLEKRLIILNFPETDKQINILKQILSYLKKFHKIAIFYSQQDETSIKNFLEWANSTGIEINKISIPEHIIAKIQKTGIKGLSQQELLKLPEVDFFNPAFAEYLKNICNSTNSTAFQNCYQAHLVRVYYYVENVLGFLSKHPHKQVFLLINKNLFFKNLGIPQILKKRHFFNFYTIEFKNLKDFNDCSDFIIN